MTVKGKASKATLVGLLMVAAATPAMSQLPYGIESAVERFGPLVEPFSWEAVEGNQEPFQLPYGIESAVERFGPLVEPFSWEAVEGNQEPFQLPYGIESAVERFGPLVEPFSWEAVEGNQEPFQLDPVVFYPFTSDTWEGPTAMEDIARYLLPVTPEIRCAILAIGRCVEDEGSYRYPVQLWSEEESHDVPGSFQQPLSFLIRGPSTSRKRLPSIPNYSVVFDIFFSPEIANAPGLDDLTYGPNFRTPSLRNGGDGPTQFIEDIEDIEDWIDGNFFCDSPECH